MSAIPKGTPYWVVAVALLVSLVLASWTISTTFNITAQTESLSVRTTPEHRSRWYLRDVDLFQGYESMQSTFTGSIQLRPGVLVSFERVGRGALRIYCGVEEPDGIVAELYSPNDEFEREVRDRLVIRIADVGDRIGRGESVVIPIAGVTEIGREVGFYTGESPALLHSGKISLLGHAFLGRSRYDAGEVTLDLGDFVTVEQAGPFSGLVVASGNPGFTAVFRVIGQRARVTRFGSEGYDVTTSLTTRIKRDPTIQAIWGTGLFLMAMVGYLRSRENK